MSVRLTLPARVPCLIIECIISQVHLPYGKASGKKSGKHSSMGKETCLTDELKLSVRLLLPAGYPSMMIHRTGMSDVTHMDDERQSSRYVSGRYFSEHCCLAL